MPRATKSGLEFLFPNSQHLVGANLGRGKITAKRKVMTNGEKQQHQRQKEKRVSYQNRIV